jgi:hypothetical protein
MPPEMFLLPEHLWVSPLLRHQQLLVRRILLQHLTLEALQQTTSQMTRRPPFLQLAEMLATLSLFLQPMVQRQKRVHT